MGLKHAIRDAFKSPRSKADSSSTPRRQYNMIVDHGITKKVRRLAVHLGIKQSTVAEHALQVGCAAMEKVLDDPERREKLHQHLVEDHELRDAPVDTDEALHIVDTHYAADAIRLSNELLRHYTNLGLLIDAARQGKVSFEKVENCKEYLTVAAYDLAVRLTKYPLDKERPVPSEARRVMANFRQPRSRLPQKPPRPVRKNRP